MNELGCKYDKTNAKLKTITQNQRPAQYHCEYNIVEKSIAFVFSLRLCMFFHVSPLLVPL